MSRAVAGLGAVLLVPALVVAAGPEFVLPKPLLGGLEAAVAEQLNSLRAAAEATLADPQSDPGTRAEVLGELGMYYQAYSLPGVARECYEVARRLAPADFRWAYLLAFLEQQEGRNEEAAVLYEKSLPLAPEATPVWFRLAETYRDLGRAAEARRLFERVLEWDPGSAASEAALGGLALSAGRLEEAIARYERALSLAPEATLLYYPLAQAWRAAGDHEEARRLLGLRGPVGVRVADPLIDSLSRRTAGARVHILRGQVAHRAARFREAAEEFAAAVDAEPGNIPARVDLAASQAALGRLDEAQRTLREAIELAPGNATARFNLGRLLDHDGQAEAAVEQYREAARYRPGDGELHYFWAQALVRAGRPGEALDLYRAAIDLEPPGELARLGEAEALVRLGRYEDAVARLEEAHGLLPASGLLARALARMLATGPALQLRDGARAVRLAQAIYSAQPTADHLGLLASALAEAGRCGEAAELLERVLEGVGGSVSEAGAPLETARAHYRSGPPCRP
jgi:tetratricopeptide (TPR) repeat protein